MIQITDKDKCCGCTACYSICPKKCIEMKPDEEGFLYPVVDTEQCVDCGACDRVCRMQKAGGTEKKESLYAAVQYKDEKKRQTSTAGGAFSWIADYILQQGGVVYAVGYDDNMVVCHKSCDNKDDLSEFRGSKYVQSTLNDTFREIKELVARGNVVLFVGTPCQVHGLKNVVGNKDNLYTIDLLCLGVSSPKLFADWIEYLNKKYKTHVSNVQFRNKHYGYATPNVRVFFGNGKEFDQKYDSRVHANLFFRHLNVRPSCYICEFREIPRVSDFTIGDFNEIASVDKPMDDDKGTTKLWAHTAKGKHLLKSIEGSVNLKVIQENNTDIVGGPKKQIKRPEKREAFFKDSMEMDYYTLVTKWEPKTVKGELVGFLRPIINKLPFKTVVFKYLRQKKMRNYQKNVQDLNQ